MRPANVVRRGAAIAAWLVAAAARADAPPPDPRAAPSPIRYEIDVTLDSATRALHGHERVRWTNPGDRPVERVPVHLYLNGFAHERTTWAKTGFLRGGEIADLRDENPDPWGYTDLVTVKQVTAAPHDVPWAPIRPDDGNPFDESLVELRLPEPVPPHGTLDLDIAFEARLPYPVARTGGDRDYFFAGQWFPKIGAFEPTGVRGAVEPRFAARQFRGLTEFYADFADWDVRVTVPDGFLVAATGTGPAAPERTPEGQQRFRFTERAVHDFAFVAGSALRAARSTLVPGPDRAPIELSIITPAGTEEQVARWRGIAEFSIRTLDARVGRYPYPTFTVVLPPSWATETGGMEYPTLVTGIMGDPLLATGPASAFRFFEETIAHEIAHNWFYGMIASNEQEEAFLDEGFTQFWQIEIMRDFAGPGGEGHDGGAILGRDLDTTDLERFIVGRSADAFREPIIKRPTGFFRSHTEGSQVYTRPALTLLTAERLFGRDTIDRVFHAYFDRFSFHHPQWADFLAVAREAGGPALGDFLAEAFTRERVPDYEVVSLDVKPWEAPLGRLPGDGGFLHEEDEREAHPEGGLDPAAREPDGRVLMEITDAGFLRGGEARMGGIERRFVDPLRRDPDKQKEAEAEKDKDKDKKGERFRESRVRLEGPAWDHLPVEVEFRFADGVVLRDRWDGRSQWRAYRFVRAAALDEVRVDPDDRLIVDPRPENNARRRKPDRAFAADWSAYLGAVVAALEGGLSLWL